VRLSQDRSVPVLRVVTASVAAAVLLAGAAVGGVLAATRIEAATPPLTPALRGTGMWVAALGSPPSIAAPAQGSLAVDAVVGSSVTHLLGSDAGTVRPIASVTKTMTALVILEVHPLAPGQDGPVLTMTQRDVNDYLTIAADGGSYAPVTLGERLSERDLLLGLMLPSANNLALTAARWVDGTVSAFVARLNARAAALGMTHTHFADPDGLDPGSTSTAADLVILGERAVDNDAMVGIVSTPTATLPDGTVVDNIDTLLGTEPGWLGIKTGWTQEAGGCLLFAARRTLSLGAPALTVVGAVLDQAPDGNVSVAHPELGGAFTAAQTAAEQAFAAYRVIRVGRGTVPLSGEVFGPWGTASALDLAGPDRTVLVRLGDPLTITAVTHSVAAPSTAGAAAGTVTVTLGGAVVGRWALVTSGSLSGPAPWWRLLHG
jgi:D-alanyl-D-alanine carboxypeptidase (penicillin-binding protein 5/6)